MKEPIKKPPVKAAEARKADEAKRTQSLKNKGLPPALAEKAAKRQTKAKAKKR